MQMPLKVFCAPARYTQGPNFTEKLGAEIHKLRLEGPALIPAGRSAIRLLSETSERAFEEGGDGLSSFPFRGECTAAEIRRGPKRREKREHA